MISNCSTPSHAVPTLKFAFLKLFLALKFHTPNIKTLFSSSASFLMLKFLHQQCPVHGGNRANSCVLTNLIMDKFCKFCEQKLLLVKSKWCIYTWFSQKLFVIQAMFCFVILSLVKNKFTSFCDFVNKTCDLATKSQVLALVKLATARHKPVLLWWNNRSHMRK